MATKPGQFWISQCNCNALRGAARRVTNFYDHCLETSGLRVTQYIILALLVERPGLSVNELAEALEIDRTTAGKNLRPLERDGLVRVVADETDGRSRRVELTGSGRAAFEIAMPLWQSAQAALESRIGAEVANGLRNTLAAIDV